jgi:EmrB/QacA subfamily drug resistance transporter
LLLAAAQLIVVLDMTIVNTALPTIQHSLGFSVSGIAWVVNGYAVAFGALLLLGGRSGDTLGRRNVFVGSLLAFAAASALCGIAGSSSVLVLARILQGASAAFAQASALALIVSTFKPGPERNRAVGVFATMEGLGAGLGLLLGGLIVQAVSWRWVFFVNVPVATVVGLLASRYIPSPKRLARRFDLAGAATGTTALGLLVFGFSRAADHGWGTLQVAFPLAAGGLGIAAFLAIESRAAEPLMPLWVFGDRNRAGGYTIQALMAAALFGFFFLSTLYLQTILGYGPLKAGAAFIPGIAVMLGIAGAASSFVARTGVRPLVATGTAIASAGMLLLSQLTPHSAYLTGVMLPMIVLCAGLGLTFVPTMLSAVSGVKDEHSGLVSGVSTTATQIGGSIGVAVLASVAATASRNQPIGTSIHTALAHGYAHAYQISALIIAAAIPVAVAALRLRPTHQHAATTNTAAEAAYEVA